MLQAVKTGLHHDRLLNLLLYSSELEYYISTAAFLLMKATG